MNTTQAEISRPVIARPLTEAVLLNIWDDFGEDHDARLEWLWSLRKHDRSTLAMGLGRRTLA